MPSPDQLMRLALDRARQGIVVGQSPFGCAIARGDEVVAVEHNTVWQTTDITAHAEVNALRTACRDAGEILLAGAIVATTCEPCPMCMAALHWARVEAVYYGATISDATRAGFNELNIPAKEIIQRGASRVQLIPGILVEECVALFSEWKSTSSGGTY